MQDNQHSHWPVVIIGGGIVGAGILRDLSLHGVKTLLIDKNKISSQTSKSSSKMLHGGIRYLENFDLRLVKEALTERNLWLKTSPELCYQQGFVIPVYKDSSRPLWMVLIGIAIYHFLSGQLKNVFSLLTKKDLKQNFPQLRHENLRGAGKYNDAIVDDELLTIKVVEDALINSSCEVWENHGLISLNKNGERLKLQVKSEDKIIDISCDELVFATGPFTDFLLTQLDCFPWSPKLLLSKGSHLWIDKNILKVPEPVVLTPKDGRVIFVIPYPDKVLVGTTEVHIESPQSDITPSEEEINYLLNNINEFFPSAEVQKSHIIGSYAGIRPLVKDDSSNSLGKTSRDHHVYQPESNIYVILGGKYTTFRVMASDIAALIVRKMNRPYLAYLTTQKLRKNNLKAE